MVVGSVVLRPMTAADHEMVGAVGFAAWLSGGALDARFEDPEIAAVARREFFAYPASAKGEVLVAEVDGSVVGWIAREDHLDHISDLWVSPDAQGKGIGSRLLRHLCSKMEHEGLPVLKVDTHANNSRAIRLYESHGFEMVWRGEEFDPALSINLMKVHFEKRV
ncbi:GNAT family N-acetyltransferase [Rhizobium rhizogenes]|uniref:GNAT family N-acetyltransferase n=1 Tax=Rhizobium rhizogenes TaxID=359 RepID=UPI00386CB7EB